MLNHIERFVRDGWDLEVSVHPSGKIRARVWLGIARDSHNYMGNDIDDALTGLNVYLATRHTRMGSPAPTRAE